MPDLNARLLEMIRKRRDQRRTGTAARTIGRPRFQGPIQRATYAGEYEGEIHPAEIDVNNFLGDWDYKNPEKLGPQNEPMPYGAIGWNPHGRPYYGDGFEGWWRGFTSRIKQPMYEGPEDVVARYEEDVYVPLGDLPPLKFGTEGKVDPIQTLKNMWQYPYAMKEDEWYKPPSLVGYGTRALQETVLTGVSAFEELDIKAEQAISVAQELEEMAEEGPEPPEWLKRPGGFRHLDIETQLSGMPEGIGREDYEWFQIRRNVKPGLLAYNLFRSLLAPGTVEGKLSRLEEAYHAGRILYSSAQEPMLEAEFLRRYRSGENPYMLAMELENPINEMAGRMFISPWNILGPIAAGLRNTARIASVEDEFFKLPRLLDEVLKLGDNVVERIPGTKIAENIQDLARAQIKVSDDIANGLSDLGRQNGFASLTADGKRFVVFRRAGELAQAIANSSNLDEAMEGYRALMQLASGNEDEIATAFTYLKHSDLKPRMFLSQAGQELGIVLRRIVGDDPEKLINAVKKVGDDPAQMVRLMDKTINRSVVGMFPTIAERVAAGEKLSWTTQSLAKFHKVTQSAAYKPINTFFAAIYMGLSPGYAARNLFNNTLTVLVDGGLGALRYRPATWTGRTSQWLGGSIPKMLHGFGKGTMGVETYKLPKAFVGRTLAEKFETWGAAQIIGVTVEREMRRMLKPGKALPDIAPLVKAGLPRETAQFLWRSVVDNKGDISKAVKAMKEAAKKGNIETFRSLGIFEPNDVLRLSQYNLADEVLEVLQKATSREDAKARLATIWDDMAKDAARVSDEAPAVDKAADGVDAVQDLGLASIKGEVDRTLNELSHSYFQANANSNKAHRSVLEELYNGSDTHPIWAKFRKYANPFSETPNGIKIAELRDKVVPYREMSFLDDFDAVKAWKDLGIPGEPPPGLDAQAFRQAAWDELYFPFAREQAQMWRDELAQATEDVFAAINPSNDGLIVEARRQLTIAQQWDDVLRQDEVRRQVTTALNRGDKAGYVRALARQFNVPSAGKTGVPLDNTRLLSLINKYLPEGADKYDDIAEVPFKVADEVFAKRIETKALEGLEAAPEAAKVATEGIAKMPAPPEPSVMQSLYKMAETPRTEIDPAVSNALMEEAYKMLSLVEAAEPGKRMFDEGKFIGSYKSTYPKWYGEIAKKAGGKEAVIRALDKIIKDAGLDKGKTVERLKTIGLKNLMDDPRVLMAVGDDAEAVRTVWRQLDEGIDVFEHYREDADSILDLLKRGDEIIAAEPQRLTLDEEIAQIPFELAEKLATPYSGGTPTMARMYHEGMDGLKDMLTRMGGVIDEKWGKLEPIWMNRQIEGALARWEKEGAGRIGQARLIASNVANEARKFTLLSYPEKRNFDLALGYIYPYHFWYNRTYANWLRRVAYNPQVIAAFGKYKNTMAKIHAGAPEWWKYNVNTNDLLGLDSDNPLFMNLEQTLNPVNGLTGVDFEDRYKRMDWLSSTLDDLNRLGPSTWTPFNIALATAYYLQGEEEASARWGGRLFPQTASIKSMLSLLNINIPTRAGVNEFDPAVQFYSGGQDPYERNRTGRALAGMEDEGLIDVATGIESSRTQNDEHWFEATKRAVRQRAPGQLASFILGTGFKTRSKSDMQIDQYYAEKFRINNLRDTLSPDEYRDMLTELDMKYSFGQMVTLARKGGIERDRVYAYNVMSRIPPGQKDEILPLVGIPTEFMGMFYDGKGNIEEWSESDRDRFMAGIVDIGAILDLPDDATKYEWDTAKDAWNVMQEDTKKIFGEDIQIRIDRYYNAIGPGEDRVKANAILEADPEISDALDWQQTIKMNDPLLSKYYTSIENVAKHYRGVMYSAKDQELGDLELVWDGWNAAKLESNKAGRAFWKAHPELERSMELSDQYGEIIANALVRFADNLVEAAYPALRTTEADSVGQQNLLDYMQVEEQTPYDYTWEDWQAIISTPIEGLVMDYAQLGEDMPDEAMDQLEYDANRLGINADVMLRLMEDSLTGNGNYYTIPEGEVEQPISTAEGVYNWEEDETLTDLARSLIHRNVMMLSPEEVGPPMREDLAGTQFALPETIARSQEAGFRRFGAMVGEQGDVRVSRHEIAHAIDATGYGLGDKPVVGQVGGVEYTSRISDQADFRNDLDKYLEDELDYKGERKEEIAYVEWFAHLFAIAQENPDKLPDIMHRWYIPFIKI